MATPFLHAYYWRSNKLRCDRRAAVLHLHANGCCTGAEWCAGPAEMGAGRRWWCMGQALQVGHETVVVRGANVGAMVRGIKGKKIRLDDRAHR